MLTSMLNDVLRDLKHESSRFQIIDTEHFLDNTTGVKWHLYKADFHLSKGGEIFMNMDSFAPKEQRVIMSIKQELRNIAVPMQRRNFQSVYTVKDKVITSYESATPDNAYNPDCIDGM